VFNMAFILTMRTQDSLYKRRVFTHSPLIDCVDTLGKFGNGYLPVYLAHRVNPIFFRCASTLAFSAATSVASCGNGSA